MNFNYENQGASTFLVYTLGIEDVVDSMSLGMITNNSIKGIAPTIFTQMDSDKFLKYNISSKISVKQFFAGVVNKKRLIGVFSGIIDAIMSAEEYMIDTNNLVLDLEYIFADVSTCETVVVCVPIETQCENIKIDGFFKNIIFGTQFDQTENCDYIAKIINYLNRGAAFSLEEFKGILEELENNSSVVSSQQQVSQPKVQPEISKVQQPQVHPVQQQPVIQNPVITQQSVKQPSQQNYNQIPTSQTKQNIEAKEEKNMSMFYLLQHYNKENAKIFKEQKERKKLKNAQNKNVKTKKENTNKSVSTGFEIPGQSNGGFVNTPQPVVKSKMQANNVQPSVESNQINQQNIQMQNSANTYQSTNGNFGETVVLSKSTIGETTVLIKEPLKPTIQPHLVRTKNNEIISINKPVFRIGKEKSYVDYFVSDNSGVSRSHADIISRGEEYFIIDANSTNHTYVNGIISPNGIETKLEHQAKIALGNEFFEFKLYY